MVPVEYGGSHVLHVKPKPLNETTWFSWIHANQPSRDVEGCDRRAFFDYVTVGLALSMIVVTLGRSSQGNMGFHHASLMDSVLAILKNSEV